jgi:5'-methylthioadenosine phosphorylase
MVIDNLTQNARTAQQVIAGVVGSIDESPRTCACATALASALITRPDFVPAETRSRLDLLVGKYLD